MHRQNQPISKSQHPNIHTSTQRYIFHYSQFDSMLVIMLSREYICISKATLQKDFRYEHEYFHFPCSALICALQWPFSCVQTHHQYKFRIMNYDEHFIFINRIDSSNWGSIVYHSRSHRLMNQQINNR